MNKKSGFTLAEVLVTLMIIGVIAAMTIPSLMQNTAQQEYKAGFKKAVSMLNQAVTLNYALDGEDATNFQGSKMFHMLTKRLNVMSTVGSNIIYTADGMRITVKGDTKNCVTDNNAIDGYCSVVEVDVNGPKGPNKATAGTKAVYDIFTIRIYPQRAVPENQAQSDVLYNK